MWTVLKCLYSETAVEASEHRLSYGNGPRPPRPVGICFPKYENTVYGHPRTVFRIMFGTWLFVTVADK
jgi:hypothetical protein